MYYYKEFWRRSFDFSGLSDIVECFVPWLFHMGVLIIPFFLLVPFELSNIYLLIVQIYFALAAIPIVSSTIRRLHDNNVGGLNILWVFVPVLGQILLITMLVYRDFNTTTKEDIKGSKRSRQKVSGSKVDAAIALSMIKSSSNKSR